MNDTNDEEPTQRHIRADTEFVCWITLALAPSLCWVNGLAGSTQFVVRTRTGLSGELWRGGAAPIRLAASGFRLMIDSCDPQTSGSSSEWYYILDGRKLVGSCGETANAVEVCQGTVGTWIFFGAVFDIPPSASVPTPSAANLISHCGTSAAAAAWRPRRSISALFQGSTEIAIAVAVWLLLNAVILAIWSRQSREEPTYRSVLRSLEAEVDALLSRSASKSEWAKLRQHAKRTLAPIVADLNKTTSASEPVRHHLLWAARDHLPSVIGAANSERTESRRHYEQYMQLVDAELCDS
jgi:hypothetical protein